MQSGDLQSFMAFAITVDEKRHILFGEGLRTVEVMVSTLVGKYVDV